MTIGRRPVLQGLAATGLAAVAPGFPDARATAAGNPDEGAFPSIAVLSTSGVGDDFLAGMARARSLAVDLAVLRIDDFGSADLQRLQATLTAGRPQTLVGLVDDGLAAIIVESARTAGARLRWLGQHTLTPTETRHRLLTASDQSAALFAEALAACGSRFSISCWAMSRGRGSQLPASSAPPAPDPAPGRWAVALGQIVALANGPETVTAGKRPLEAAFARPEPSRGHPPESFVSFSFKL